VTEDPIGFENDESAELEFAPAVSSSGAHSESEERPSKDVKARQSRRWRRRIAGGVVLLAALITMGTAYAAFANSSGAAGSSAAQADINKGRSIYETTCISCHGAHLEGVPGRGVTLVGAGAAAVYFQVSTGRMPLTGQGAFAPRKPPKYSEEDINDLAAYVQSVGGGPTVPSGDLRRGNLAEGGELFRLNCASCHGSTGKGAPLSAGALAWSLENATDKQMYTAMLSGPENMPVFSDNQLTSDEKRAIINYLQTIKAARDPGGSGLDRIGPVSEGIVIWVVGIGAVIATILWIGAKS
jgi:ubiquinol-cytochrome c reductase cytochrome c subunit